ncbi:MAG: HAMP domain-containing sensor histidine kinase [Trueperaceae bacterium]
MPDRSAARPSPHAGRQASRPRRLPDRRTVTRIAFGVIVVFVTAQALWWVAFQRDYIQRTSEARLEAWAHDAELADRALGAARDPDALREAVLQASPHLRFDGERFVVAAGVRDAFLDQQRGYLRMFAWEGPFFVAVILAMLALIAASLRQERSLKRSQQNFLSAITHEFTTPLATLRLLVQTAQMRDLDADRRREYLSRMTTELDRLERTSSQVLAAARLEQTPDAPRLEPCDLRTVVRRQLDAARPGLQARGAKVRLVGDDEPLPVSLQPEAFALVLSNLLDNAVKYGRSRSARDDDPLEVIVQLEDRGHLVTLHVDDGGDGVPEADRERIFDRFYRRGDESTRSAPGTGLGLYLVRRTGEAMNGWVKADANPAGSGARFTIHLPRRVAGEDALESDASPRNHGSSDAARGGAS